MNIKYEYNFMSSIKCFYGEHLLKEPLYSFNEIMFRDLVFIGTFWGSQFVK